MAFDDATLILRARQIFGLDELDTAPPALPMRIESWWETDGFAAVVPHTGAIFIPFGRSPNLEALAAAIAAIVRRHEALRSRLKVENGHAWLVPDNRRPQFQVVAAPKAAIAAQREGQHVVSEFLRTPIHLMDESGFRFRGFRDEDGDVTLVILMHHYFGDAWSSQVLRREIEALYAAAVKGETAELPPVAQYSDYALAQRRSLADKLPAHIAFWRAKLGDPQPPNFPLEHDGHNDRLERALFLVPDAVLVKLAALARDSRISLAMLCYSAFQIALARWCGQDVIVSAANSIDRIKMQFRDTVGSLMASIPVASKIVPDMPAREFLRLTAKDFYDAIAHQELAFEQYDKIFAPPQPFCSARFNFVPRQKSFDVNQEAETPQITGVQKAPGMRKIAAFRDLHIFLIEYPHGIAGRITYNPDFAFEKIVTFITSFQSVLAAIADNPDTKLGEL